MKGVHDFTVLRPDSPQAFLDEASGFLLIAEARNNLLLSIPRSLLRSGEASGPREGPFYFATVHGPDGIVGCAVRTPPNKLVLSAMPAEAARAVARDVGTVYTSVPVMLAPPDVADAFATEWVATHDVRPRVGTEQRIYVLETLEAPDLARWPEGQARVARSGDLPRLVRWIKDSAGPFTDAETVARGLVQREAAMVWERPGSTGPESVAMAAIVGSTPNGVRIGAVYTPPAERRRGYGTAITHAVTERALERPDVRFTFLYTDLANPTSNAIYQRIGYRPIGDAVDLHFE